MSTLTPVKPIEIEKELIEQRRQIEGLDRVKATLFNLVVRVQDPSRTNHVLKVCHLLTERFPLRLLLLIEDSSATELDVEVAVKTLGEEDRRISCDQIEIRYPSHMAERVPFIILSHLLPDLPVYLLWTGPQLEDTAIFPMIAPYTSRIFFNPDSLDSLPNYAQYTLRLIQDQKRDVVDLKWAYTKAWRQVLARGFHTPERVKHLTHAQSLTLIYGQYASDYQRDPRIQATYLQAWLAARLGWTFHSLTQEASVTSIEYQGPNQTVHVRLIPEERPDRHFGAITAISLETQDGCQYFFTENQDGSYVKCKMETPELCALPYAVYLPHPDQDQVLARKIFEPGISPHFHDTLRLLSTALEGAWL